MRSRFYVTGLPVSQYCCSLILSWRLSCQSDTRPSFRPKQLALSQLSGRVKVVVVLSPIGENALFSVDGSKLSCTARHFARTSLRPSSSCCNRDARDSNLSRPSHKQRGKGNPEQTERGAIAPRVPYQSQGDRIPRAKSLDHRDLCKSRKSSNAVLRWEMRVGFLPSVTVFLAVTLKWQREGF